MKFTKIALFLFIILAGLKAHAQPNSDDLKAKREKYNHELEELNREYEETAIYKISSLKQLMFIFAAKEFNQSYKRMNYLQEFAGYRERQAQYIEGTENDLHARI